jgi:hypothetical protein
MILVMEPLRISEGDLAKDVRSILQQVETRPAQPVRRLLSECIALIPADSTATIDADFANDVEAAIDAHRDPLEPPDWHPDDRN